MNEDFTKKIKTKGITFYHISIKKSSPTFRK
jgi:hypothetical protein